MEKYTRSGLEGKSGLFGLGEREAELAELRDLVDAEGDGGVAEIDGYSSSGAMFSSHSMSARSTGLDRALFIAISPRVDTTHKS